jgi:Ca2+-dependent lipid-binding protein
LDYAGCQTDSRQPIKTDPSQSLADYKEAQDVTAPPDPVTEGTTSDVPIHGEKTNVLFHPTPSVSYEPMFAELEKRAGILCIGIVVVTIVVGKLFGGALKGLVPLAMCLASGVWLWMKEVVRSGREVEWSSEQSRGQMVSMMEFQSREIANICRPPSTFFPSQLNG